MPIRRWQGTLRWWLWDMVLLVSVRFLPTSSPPSFFLLPFPCPSLPAPLPLSQPLVPMVAAKARILKGAAGTSGPPSPHGPVKGAIICQKACAPLHALQSLDLASWAPDGTRICGRPPGLDLALRQAPELTASPSSPRALKWLLVQNRRCCSLGCQGWSLCWLPCVTVPSPLRPPGNRDSAAQAPPSWAAGLNEVTDAAVQPREAVPGNPNAEHFVSCSPRGAPALSPEQL